MDPMLAVTGRTLLRRGAASMVRRNSCCSWPSCQSHHDGAKFLLAHQSGAFSGSMVSEKRPDGVASSAIGVIFDGIVLAFGFRMFSATHQAFLSTRIDRRFS